MKVLIVDDSKAMRMITVRTLRQIEFGEFRVLEAANGAEALKLLEAESPDVVFSDWNMPEMNGIEFLKAVRGAGNSVRFGFVTSESSPAIRQQAEEAGASFLITKPFTPQAFESALRLIST